MAGASRLPGGVRTASKLLSGTIFNEDESASENPTQDDLAKALVAVCSFPRSGSTYLEAVLSDALGGTDRCWRNHDVLSIPIFLAAAIPTIVPVRDPVSTVVSWSVYNRDEPSKTNMARRLSTYIAWHRKALRLAKSPLVNVVDFTDILDDPRGALGPVITEAGLLAHVDWRRVKEADAVVRTMDLRGLRHGVFGNLPSSGRDAMKAPYLEMVASPPLHARLARAQSIHQRLLQGRAFSRSRGSGAL